MKIRLRIKEIAKERGMTLSEIAGRLGIPRSNMSAIASGARGVSLKALYKIGKILDCGIEELFSQDQGSAVFKDAKAQRSLKIIEDRNYDGSDKTWVNRAMLAQKAHYGSARRGEQ
ncbi:MAG: helix-turn-helix transcriptional regulator [Candidatus Omnitrophota bacterium]